MKQKRIYNNNNNKCTGTKNTAIHIYKAVANCDLSPVDW